jgi:hypothetical protein
MSTPLNDNTILFPPGRIVQGDLYAPQDTDLQGNPLTIKTGQNAGKPRVNYYFALAIAKTPGVSHWGSEPGWGAKVWAMTHAFWPSIIDPTKGYITRKFSWKVEDGDSQEPNENNRKNCDREGHPGHWILKFGSSFPTKIFDENAQPLLAPGLVKRGYYIEVVGSIASNDNAQKPGIYLNHNMVAYRPSSAKEIMSGPDPRSVGFGRSALPAGVTAAPMANVANFPAQMAAPGAPATPYAPPAVGGAPTMPGAAVAPPAGPPATPVGVQPHAGFIAPPVAGAFPSVPPAAGVPAPYSPPAAPAAPSAPASYVDPLGAPAGYRMANPSGARYPDYATKGWNDAQLLAGGHMVRL